MSVTHRTLSVAVESSFGSLSASTGLPDNSGLTFTSIPCERDPIIIYGDVVVSERNDARDGTYGNAPEPDTVWSGGSRVRRRTGQVNLRVDLTTIGTASTNYNSNYLGHLLGGGFLRQLAGINSDTVASAIDVNTFTPTATSTDYSVGSLIGVGPLNGRAEYSAVTDDDVSGNVTVSPAFSSDTSGQLVYLLENWFPAQRGDMGSTAHSLSFRVDGVDFRSYAYGCRLETMSLTLDNGRVMADLTYQAALIQDDHGNAVGPVEPVYNSGAPCFFRGSYAVISSGSPTSTTDASTGDTLGRIALDVDEFTLTVTNTLTPKGHSNSILAMSDMEVSDVDVELSLTLSNVNTTINNDFFNRTLRQVLIGFGPLAEGQGGAFMLPAAYLTADPSKYDPSGNDIVRQQLTYKQARFGGDIADTGKAYNTPFRLALGKGF
jgi:hypothetical protein